MRNGSQDHATERLIDQPAPTVLASADNGDTKWVYGRPSTTVMGDGRVFGPHAGSAGESQSEKAVKVTLAELARLQDFPDGWPFVGNRSSQARQIGNAVCPAVAEACVRAVTGTTP